MKKILSIVTIVAFAAISAWNFSQRTYNATNSDLTFENLNAIAKGRGIFPACQKTELSNGERRVIPFCVNGQCQQTWEIPYKLDVNYCNETSD